MTASQNLRHRRAVAAQRREPHPQLGFDPGDPSGLFGGFSDLFPQPTSTSTTSLTLILPTSSTTISTSSTIPSTTSTSTTPTSTSTTSTTPTTTATPTTSSSSLVTTTAAPLTTAIVTVTRSSSSVAAATSSSVAAGSSSTSSGVSTGVVVGGIGAAVVAIGVIGFAILYFIRRSRKRDNDEFDAHNFRRSAVLMEDPPTHDDTIVHGFNPRPPTMIERHLASPAPTFGTQYGHPGPGYNHEDQYGNYGSENMAGYGASFQSFAPGQVINNNANESPISATSAHPMYNGAGYNQSPFSPIGAPDEYQENGLTRQPSLGSGLGHQAYPEPPAYAGPGVVLTRQGSNEGKQRQGSPTAFKRESAPADDYVDLNRSSVSPYQAAQYQEISRRLNTEVPEGLPSAQVDRELPALPSKQTVSPFADPSSAPPSPGGQYAIDRRKFSQDGRPLSGDSTHTHTLEFPIPPSPAHPPTVSRYRIDSMPPTLPEIHVESRVSVGNYPVLNRDTATDSLIVAANGLSTGTGSCFPTTPSPLASSFPSSPAPDAGSFTGHPQIPAPPAAFSPAAAHGGASNFKAKRQSMHSLYDDEDAYGGF